MVSACHAARDIGSKMVNAHILNAQMTPTMMKDLVFARNAIKVALPVLESS